jgi:hypothetical protein
MEENKFWPYTSIKIPVLNIPNTIELNDHRNNFFCKISPNLIKNI